MLIEHTKVCARKHRIPFSFIRRFYYIKATRKSAVDEIAELKKTLTRYITITTVNSIKSFPILNLTCYITMLFALHLDPCHSTQRFLFLFLFFAIADNSFCIVFIILKYRFKQLDIFDRSSQSFHFRQSFFCRFQRQMIS